MRNLTKTLVAVSLLTSTSVYSLGIGGIKLRSALNQKLNAEIALVASGGESVDSIQVKLASPAKFDEAGVPWSYFLTKIRFTPAVKADGSIVVKLTSDEVLKEPFLDFLLEVTGDNGSLFREFTVLVDPPTTYKQAVTPVVTRVKPPIARRDDFSEPDVDAKPKSIERVDNNDAAASVSEYGPVRRSDTIWSIANQVKSDDVSAAQMVMAIYEANPRAFSRPNVNALLAGEMLSIPDRGDVLRLSQSQALAEFKQQGEPERKHVAQPSIADKKIAHAVVEPKQKHAKLPVQTDGVGVKPAAIKQLKLVTPLEGDISGDVDNGAGSEQNNIVSGRASAASASGTNTAKDDADLKQRFEHIEQQLLVMQKMLEVKDTQLASLQNKQLSANPSTAPAVDVLPVTPLASLPATNTKPNSLDTNPALAIAEPEPMVDAAPAQINSTPAPSIAPIPVVPEADPFADYYLLAGGLAVSLLGGLALMWSRKRNVKEVIDTESMFASASQISLPDADKNVSMPTDHSTSYEVGMMGESAFLSEFTPSEFDAFETEQTEIDPTSEADVYLAYGRYQQAEELIRQVIVDHPERNECKLKLLEILQASDNKSGFDQYVQQLVADGKQTETAFWAKVEEMVDEFSFDANPLASSDGSSASLSAPTLLTKAVLSTQAESEYKPTTDDFDLDALSDDKPVAMPVIKTGIPMEKTAAPITVLDQDNDFSSGMTFGGSDFSPENDTPYDVGTLKSNSAHDMAFDLSAFSPDTFLSQDESLEFIDDEDDNGLDFDLNAFATESTAAFDNKPFDVISAGDDNGLDFDLNAFATESTVAFDNKPFDVISADDDNGLDFDLNTFATEHAFSDDASIDLMSTDDTNSLDFDFNTFESMTATDESVPLMDFSNENLDRNTESAVDGQDDDEFNFNFDFSPAPSAMPNKIDKTAGNVEVSDLTDSYSSFETKVNLANAYVDMGDIEAAKDIANDLLEGTVEQKKAGHEILEKIS
ncbi:MAG: FimV/HubP family polar landmark protein [Methylococcaceae bacterium]